MGGKPARRKSARSPWRIDAADALRAIQGALAARADAGALAGFLRRIRNRAADGEALPLAEDADSLRFLERLGVVGSRSQDRAAAETASFLDEAARAGGPEPAVGSVLIRGFASGIYGVVTETVCGDEPRCDACPLAESCLHAVSPHEAAIRYGPGESPGERIETEGPKNLSPDELLALLAATGGKEGEAVRACARLLAQGAGLRAIAEMSPAELARAKGVSPRQARAIAAAMELARRWAVEPRPTGKPFHSGRDFFDYYRLRLRDLRKECFVAVILDQKNRFLSDEVCSEGSLTMSLVHPREVFRRAIRECAAAVAFVHNHPSGDPTPSSHDREITSRLADVSKLLGIRLLDHVGVGDTSYVSFVEQGWL